MMRSNFSPVTALRVLLCVVAVLTVASTSLKVAAVSTASKPFDGFDRLVLLLDVDLEANVPSWFSCSLLLGAAVLLWGTARAGVVSGDRWSRHWAVLAVVFVYLSLDELAGLHELAIPVVDRVLDVGGVLTFGWVVVAAPLAAALALVYIGFLRALPRRTAAGLLSAGALYVGGALGVELLGGWVVSTIGRETVAYALTTSLEELLEMLGATVLLFVLADHQQRYLPSTADVPVLVRS